MADQQQLDLLLQGVEAWNAWRKQHPDIPLDLSGAGLIEANLSGATLSGATLSRAILIKTDLSGATLSRVTLNEATLYGVNLRGANLRATSLRDTNLNVADLNRADLNRADLGGARLIGANFSGANLKGANLSRASIGWTIFGDVDLRMVRGLETVKHDAPSTIGADTLLRSEGDIPEKFLRGAGLTNTFIAYAHSLTQNPNEYYTCFISYSHKDKKFADRLYTDLRAKNVQCWCDSEDLKIGDEFRSSIEESIQKYDKLLVIISQHSIQSAWVKTEVEAAFEKERCQNKLVLFPIKLDETVEQTTEAWAANIRRRKFIGNFVKWKDQKAYQVAFGRLLHDLQARTIPPMRQS